LSVSEYGYIPYGALDTSSTGRTTRESSRTLEVSIPTCGPNLCFAHSAYFALFSTKVRV
jgi:hypothetical protein